VVNFGISWETVPSQGLGAAWMQLYGQEDRDDTYVGTAVGRFSVV